MRHFPSSFIIFRRLPVAVRHLSASFHRFRRVLSHSATSDSDPLPSDTYQRSLAHVIDAAAAA